MIKVKIEGAQAAMARLAGQQKQVAYAASRALNTLAFKAMKEGQDHIRQRINQPTNFTVKSWYVRRKATKQKMEAVVGWSDYLSSKRTQDGQFAGAEYYLAQHWNGGGRKYKAFEKHLSRTGILPAGMFAVPGQAAADLGMIDASGNMKASVIVAIMSGVGGFDELGYQANATVRQSKRRSASARAKRHVYWAGKPGKNTPAGIWVIDDKHSDRGRLRPVIVFVRAPRYRVRLDIGVIHQRVVAAGFRAEFDKELAAALRSAR